MKQAKQAQQAQVQQAQQAQVQQAQQAQVQQAQTQVYFITFAHKVSPERARQIVYELRRRYGGITIFTRRPPAGRKVIHNINDVVVIITFPYIRSNDQEKKEQCFTQEGFKLKDLIKKT